MKFYELMSYIVKDPRMDNHFGFQECWEIYIFKRIENMEVLRCQ